MADDEKGGATDIVSSVAGAAVGLAAISHAPAVLGTFGALFLHKPTEPLTQVMKQLETTSYLTRKWQAFRAMPTSLQIGSVAVGALLGVATGYAVHQARMGDADSLRIFSIVW